MIKVYQADKIDPLISAILSKHMAFKYLEIKTPRQIDKLSSNTPPLGSAGAEKDPLINPVPKLRDGNSNQLS